jgi:betaine lipid synthase
MFGEGRHPDFRHLLDSKIAPHISSAAYTFWRANEDAFSSAFYLRGYSGWAIYLMRIIFKCAGVSGYVKDFCNAETLQEQDRIWWAHLRPVMLNPIVVALMKNPVFCWNALGVPLNQREMLLNDGAPRMCSTSLFVLICSDRWCL